MKKANVISGQLVHNVALVLGGGGAAGNAWQIGIIAGLAEAGLDMTEAADLVIGTSSGATAAAQVRSGITGTAAVPANGHRVRTDEGHRRRRHLGGRSTTCDGRVRVGERLHTRTRGGTAARNRRRQVASS